MKEFAAIVEALGRNPARAVLATLVSVEGSSYRRPGSRMLILDDGTTVGTLSGGCLEAEICENAFAWTAQGPVLKSFDISGDSESAMDLVGWGSGCNGVLGVLLEPVAAKAPLLRAIQQQLDARKSCAVATLFSASGGMGSAIGSTLVICGDNISGDLSAPLRNAVGQDALAALACGHSRNFTYEIPGGMAQVFVEVLKPPVSLLLFGAGSGASAVAQTARQLGWRVTVLDKRPVEQVRPLFPHADSVLELDGVSIPGELIDEQTAAVVMTHHFLDDVAIVGALLHTPVRYVGLLGGRTRAKRLSAELARDFPAAKLGRLHSPVGLDIGAVDPDEIAVAIVAEIIAALRGRSGGSLRERTGAMHFDTHPIKRHVNAVAAGNRAPEYVVPMGLKW